MRSTILSRIKNDTADSSGMEVRGGQHGNRAVNGAAREAVFAYKLVSGRNFCVYGKSPVFDFRHDFTAQRFDFSLHVFSPA